MYRCEFTFLYYYSTIRIYVNWQKPLTIGENVFMHFHKRKCTLYVPKGARIEYQDTEYWNNFGNIVEYDFTENDNPGTDNGAAETVRYSANGQQVAAPVKGLNIVKYSDGSTRKVVVK